MDGAPACGAGGPGFKSRRAHTPDTWIKTSIIALAGFSAESRTHRQNLAVSRGRENIEYKGMYAGAGIRTRDNGDAPSDQPDEDYEPRTLARLSYPGPIVKESPFFI